jgi:signal peptidase II
LTQRSNHLLRTIAVRMHPRVVYATTIAFVLVLDHATKLAASIWPSRREAVTALDGAIVLAYAKNPGAFLSLGATLDPEYRFWLFTIGVGVVLLMIAVYLFAGKRGSLTDGLLFSLILGGGLSNWIDRITGQGLVVDFINLGIGSLRTGIFNLADFALTLAVIALAGKEIFFRQTKASRQHG